MGISRDLNNLYFSNEKNYSYLLDKNAQSEFPTINKSTRSVAIVDILSNKELEGLLSNAIVINHLANLESKSLRLRIMQILDLLEQEIHNQD